MEGEKEKVTLNDAGGWDAPEGSPHRSLTAAEVEDARRMAHTTTPEFGTGDPKDGNAAWEQHHPVAREVWENRGVKPK